MAKKVKITSKEKYYYRHNRYVTLYRDENNCVWFNVSQIDGILNVAGGIEWMVSFYTAFKPHTTRVNLPEQSLFIGVEGIILLQTLNPENQDIKDFIAWLNIKCGIDMSFSEPADQNLPF